MANETSDNFKQMKEQLDRTKLHTDVNDLGRNLDINLQLFEDGHQFTYRIIALILRIFLCDSYRKSDISLLPRIIESPKLHAINTSNSIYLMNELHKSGHLPTFSVVFTRPQNPAEHKLDDFFLLNEPPVPIQEWLEQPMFGNVLTIREFIREIADSEGAHADKQYKQIQVIANSLYSGMNLRDRDLIIYLFGKYLLQYLEDQLGSGEVE